VRTARPAALALASALVAAGVGGGCGVTRLQTARTTPRGQTRTTIGASLVHLGDRGYRVDGLPAVPLEVMVRHGATDHVDWGVRQLFGLGALADVKWSLLAPERRTAVAVSAGLGLAFDGAGIIHVPLTLTASHALLPWLTPYAAVGYGTYWIFGYGMPDQTRSYAGRTGTGDGLLGLHVGLELSRASGLALLLEYSHVRPIVDDPGDFYSFATNQFFSIALRTGSGPAMRR
jgi:hypothetical protein